MGHSVGEYVAATIGGVFSLEDGLKLIATRGNLIRTYAQALYLVGANAIYPYIWRFKG
jgi:acyl transferase domain-containing protein